MSSLSLRQFLAACALALLACTANASYTLGNGITHSLTQNTRGLPATNTDGNVLQDVYTYDANANVTGIADQIYGKSRGMAYDGQDRLSTTNAPNLWGNGSFSYNALDNLTASTLGARNSSHNYDSTTNRLQSINTNGVYTGFSFDAQGNVTAKGSQGYVFDQANRLKLASGPANTTYTYDGLGRRVFATASSTSPSRTTVYSQAGQVLYSTAQAGTVVNTTSYVYLGGKLIGEVGTTGRVYSHTDALGSPVARTNQAAQFISNTWYEPYGKTAGGVQPQLLGFTGHVNDIDTGLVYMQQRYYDPVAGRFLSVDPVTTDAESGRGFGRYHYAENNPYKYTDPDGRSAALAACAAGPVGCAIGVTVTAIVAGKAAYDTYRALKNYSGAMNNESAEAPKSDGVKKPDSASGNEKDPADKSGELTKAGRAGQKHGDRPGSAFEPETGTPEDKNAQGQKTLESITGSPDKTNEPNHRGGTDVRESPDGRGARFDKDGKFTGFIEPRRPSQ